MSILKSTPRTKNVSFVFKMMPAFEESGHAHEFDQATPPTKIHDQKNLDRRFVASICSDVRETDFRSDFDGDDLDDVVAADESAVTVRFGSGTTRVLPTGVPAAGDATGDGLDDLVVGWSGGFAVYRGAMAGEGTVGGLVPAVSRFLWRPAGSRFQPAELDGDGLPDLFVLGADPDPTDDVDLWSGTLVQVRGPSAP